MDNKLFTLIEIGVIAGLILAVMYFGGIFDSKPDPTFRPPTSVVDLPSPTVTLTITPRPTRTLRPTLVPSLTPTTPPLVSPSGLIAFETTRDGNAEIYTMQADGSEVKDLTQNPAEDMQFTWSPDGSRIAFFSTRTGWLEIFVMDADGSNVTQISNLEGTNTVYSPPLAWSPAGQYLLALQMPLWKSPNTEGIQSLVLLPSDGNRPSQTLYLTQNGSLWQPGWSPDGRYITLTIMDSQSCGTYIAGFPAASSSLLDFRPLTPNCVAFSWSPDGGLLAYPDGIIRFMSLNGAEQLTLWEYTNAYSYIDWSPDGKHLLYGNANGWVDAISTDGARQIDLHLSQSEPPNWAPDGQWVAYVDQQTTDIGILNIYDPSYRILLTNNNSSYAPQWQPRP